MRGTPLLRLVSFLVFLVATGCFVAAFCSSFWYRRRDRVYNILVHHGLWVLCDYWFETEEKCRSLTGMHINQKNGMSRTVQAMMCISLILAVVTMLLYFVWFCQKSKQLGSERAKKIGRVTLWFCLLTGILNDVAIIIFGANYAKYDEVLNWSYGLAVGSGGLYTLSGIFCLVSKKYYVHDSYEAPGMPLNVERTRAMPSLPSHAAWEGRQPDHFADNAVYMDTHNQSMASEPTIYASSVDHQDFHQNSVV